MTTGETIGIVCVIIATALIVIGSINYRIREDEFKAWLAIFEMGLGCQVPEEDVDGILRDLFTNEDILIDEAIELYKELKELKGEKNN